MLTGQQIFLRKMEIDDTDDIVRWRNSEEVRSRFLYQEPFTREKHLDWIENKVNKGLVVQMMICEKETGRAIGSAYFRDIDHANHKAEYGLFIGESDSRVKGIGFETTRLMLRYGFEELNLHRVHARVLSDNIVSLKSAIKAGLEVEGTLRDDIILQGKYRDVVLLGALKERFFETCKE